ncbi:MAG TPA: prepilin-type N-terminal cleavage/methylation domain-containing protein [Gemmatimonadales bacterium]|nr:prepilin-type N-terminal cleavage/methylation domain-containing protein [Gemmatimonadales bacterium]
MIRGRDGFTLVEMMIAMIILSIGLLGLASTMAMSTRMIGRGQRSTAAAAFASQRLERSRMAACISSQRQPGSETMTRGGTWVAINTWAFSDAGNNTYRVRVVTTAKTIKNRVRTDTLETAVTC